MGTIIDAHVQHVANADHANDAVSVLYGNVANTSCPQARYKSRRRLEYCGQNECSSKPIYQMGEIAMRAGSSLRRFNAVFAEVYRRTPTEIRNVSCR